ncbi:MAG: hypothetical protein PHE38_05220 [Alishewanella agri]|jgi:hypothetical protein|uniref:Uncharacterized protein n=1 Tax=Alishewanella aestuarii B11 TaxID=1197174 RepID=J2IDY7_9ALTE|nr:MULTISPECIES: hypothetical protein [Alishewanella]EJI84889.1 hypothetical protein AEST_19910 [Alishewanella aestuarii B11]MDD4863390.1 hypothetical protein [Alishewanella agri]OCW96229.1 hypothetical protein A9165_12470 [Alishewanella sp. HH-ZS]
MQGHDPKDQNAAKMNRRKFLTRTGAGLVIASIPARSVWASSGGLTQSIVASGHGSNFTNSEPIRLKSSGFFGNPGRGSQASSGFGYDNVTFSSIFSGPPLPTIEERQLKRRKKSMQNITISDVVTVNNTWCHGDNQVNRFMAALYLNAINHGKFGIHFPIIGSSATFLTDRDFAIYLYNMGLRHGGQFGLELQQLFSQSLQA